jgi:hypothetical protein
MKTLRLLASLSLVILLFLGPASAFCQEKHQAGVHFMLGFPQGEFKQNVENAGLGANFYYAYHFPRSLFSVGVSFAFLIYGSETRVEPLSPTIPDITVDVTTKNSILLCHLFLRLQPQKGTFRPYLDGLVGLNYLTTDTSIDNYNDYDGYDNDISSNNYNDLAFSYGVGVGAMVNLLQVRRYESGRRIFSMDLDVGVRYIRGGEAEYLKEGSIHRQNGTVSYDVYRSRTDLLGAYIGLSFNF